VDVHDGNTVSYNGEYYYFGAAYGSCKEPDGPNGCAGEAKGSCGFREDHNVSLYTSTDMTTWTYKGAVYSMLNAPVPGILFCPKVLYNPSTQMWVLWYNWIGSGPPDEWFDFSVYAIAISPSPEGPFKVINNNISLAYPDTGDFALFQDTDGTGYIAYSSQINTSPVRQHHHVSVEKLAPDYLSSLGNESTSGYFGDGFSEAPTMWKRNNTYYVSFGPLCCYCGQGSPAKYYTAPSPLGPYTTQTVLDPDLQAQQTNVVAVNTNSGTQYIWQGDRWQTAPDGEKGHDFQFWIPLTFDDEGNIASFSFVNNFTLDILPPPTRC